MGVVLGGLFIGDVGIQSIRHDVGRLERQGLAVRWKALKEASWALGMPVIILGGIYSGMFTATEAAAISVVYALIVEGLVYRELTLRQLADIVEGARSEEQTSELHSLMRLSYAVFC